MGAPTWPPNPQCSERPAEPCAPLNKSGAPTWPPISPPPRSERPGQAVTLLYDASSGLAVLAAEDLAHDVASAEGRDDHRQRVIAQGSAERLGPARERPPGHLHQLLVGAARELAGAVTYDGDRPFHLVFHDDAPRPAQAIGRARRARPPSSSGASD